MRRIGVIHEASQSLLTVVDDILDYSKIEAGRIELSPAPFELEPWLDSTLSIVSGLARRKGLSLEVTVCAQARGWRTGDSGRLRQVLLNLLNNAMKFTERGGVVLTVAAGGTADALRFSVADTGIGIAADAIDSLFQRFQQADSSISRAFGGTGLGLAISKRLVELMGGSIGVESTAGVGSIFWFEVCLPPVAGAPSGAVAAAAEAFAMKVLLVDDLAANREIGKLVLNAIGCEATTAASGEEAIALLNLSAFDVVFMDVHMPGLDGLETTRLIRGGGGPSAATPILAVTANVLPEQIRACLEAGMNGHVGKPFRPADLCEALSRLAAPSSIDERAQGAA
jgi:CheY-like chemotaxis protein